VLTACAPLRGSPRPPAWALAAARADEPRIEVAAFAAGAALAALDALVRDDAPFAGAWRARLALRSAAASLASLGRPEREAELRDARALTRAGGDPGPAGRVYAAWRGLSRARLGDLAAALGVDAAALAPLPPRRRSRARPAASRSASRWPIARSPQASAGRSRCRCWRRS
jgi:hypothetical protein